MITTTQATNSTGMQAEFVDRLRGYRFAAEIRRSGAYPDVRVWHTHATVVVDLPGARASDASLASLNAESGGPSMRWVTQVGHEGLVLGRVLGQGEARQTSE